MNNTDLNLPPEPLTDREQEILRLMAEGHSNPEIAGRLILGLETIRWYTKQIYSKLGVHSRTQASLLARDLGLVEGGPVVTPPPALPPLLPQYTTPFIGRETELAEISGLLADPHLRLLTIAGPGGIGKTRLCLEVLATLGARFADGVVFVPLLAARAANDITLAIARTLNLSLSDTQAPQPQLLQQLQSRQLLLALDNFEHILEGTELVSAILAAAPGVKIIVTSQASLNLRGEWVRFIDALSVPPGMVADLETYGAVRLFTDCVRRVRGNFVLADHQDCVVHICQMVYGVPLAIELAAAWLKTLTCDDVAREIQSNIDFLATTQRDTEERHRSLRAVFDYTWKLLTPEEQAVFRRLSVFRGGFGLAAAQQVAGASVPMLAELVGKSLLQRTATGLYEIHDLLRQYAERKLEMLDTKQRSVRSSKLLAWSSLVRGNFDKLQEVAQSILRTSAESNDDEKGFALAALGVLAGIEGDFIRCLQFCQAGQVLIQSDPIAFIFLDFGLAVVGCDAHDYVAVKRHVRSALRLASSLRGPVFNVLCLPLAAIVLAYELKPEQAVEVMALAFTHPAATLGWIERWPLIVQLRADLEADLGAEDYAAAWERGQTLDLDQVTTDLLTAF